MIDLGCETDGNNEICLGVHFALCIIKSSTTRSYWALFLGQWSPSSFSVIRSYAMWLSTVFHSPVSHGMEFPWQAVSRLATQERLRWKNDRFHHGDTMAGLFLRERHVERGACWISICVFSFRVFFAFVFVLFLLLFIFFPLLLFSFSIFYFSFCCLSFRFFPLSPRHTNMASRQINRTPKVVVFSFFLLL